MEKNKRFYVYKVDHDLGINPNPFGEYCTLGCCKPKLRSGIFNFYSKNSTNNEVWVIGIGGANLGKEYYGKVIYAMQVTEAIPCEKYKNNARFNYKVARNASGGWHEENHKMWKNNNNWMCCGDLDASDGYVLVSDRFTYWGSKACEQTERFIDLLEKNKDKMRGHRVNFNDNVHEKIKIWLDNNFKDEKCLARPVFSSPDFAVPIATDIAAMTKQTDSGIAVKLESCNKKKANTDTLKRGGC